MSAYLLARVNVTDMEQYKEYMKLTPAILEKFGGQFIVRGGETVVLEGPEEKTRMVLIEFPSLERVVEFYNSDEYQAAIEVRRNAAIASFIALDGVS
jgi:uncharacterized protein (DUF1330 family)